MSPHQAAAKQIEIFAVKDYLTDGKRLYYVEEVLPDGMFLLENCETEFTIEVDFSFVKNLHHVK